jgi:hypothetical protein
MMVRDAAVADVVPKMSQLQGYGGGNSPRLIYNLGHAVFEFIEAKWGKEGIRGFIFALRKSVIGGGEDAYEEAFQMRPVEFDQAFDRYLKDRFRPFRDKERPADYGMNLAPDPEKSPFMQAFTIAPSPSGDLLAAMTVNRKDREYDIVLLSAKDGSIFKNLTDGFDKDMGFSYLSIPGERYTMVHWLAWSPKGDRIAYFARTEKERALIVQNVTTRKIEVKIPARFVDEPESPSFSPDGQTVAFSALTGGISDIFTVDLATGKGENLTNDEFFDYAPTYSPDGKFLVYLVRISGNQKLFKLDLATKQKTQLTFGTHDEGSAHFVDANTIVFSSTATDPNVPLEPEVARNGNIFNIWTLDLTTGELKQYTDALGGNLSPVVLNEGEDKRIAFVSYYRDEYGIHTLDRKEPLHTAASADFGSPGPIIDFQAPMAHTLVADNNRKKTRFEKMFLEGRPPVNLGVTSSGDVYGGTAITFGDVLGDQQFNVFASSIAQHRSLAVSYTNLSRRFQFALQGFSQTQFFYGALEGVFYDPALAPLVSRDQAVATRTTQGGSAFAIYPFNRYRRLEMSTGFYNLKEEYSEQSVQDYLNFYGLQPQNVFRSGSIVPLSVAYIQETTVFREFGPLAGNTLRIGYDYAPKIAGTLSRQTFDIDARYYQRLATSGVLALRFRGFKSTGEYPDYMYFGGNSEMRGYDYLQFIGQSVMFANAELRFPIIEAALTPIGVIGGIRGVFFANIGGGWFPNSGFEFATNRPEPHTPIIGYQSDASGSPFIDVTTGLPIPIYGQERIVQGWRLKDGRASYGVGLETFMLGFPIHFDWAWRSLFNEEWENVLFAANGGSSEFRQAQFAVWIGYDF